MIGMVSPHFSWEEVVRSRTAEAEGLQNLPGRGFRLNIGRTAQFMEVVRHLLGGHPIVVTSWYRSEALNTAISGSPSSAHMRGLAMDFVVQGVDLWEVFYTIKAADLPLDQLIIEQTFSSRWIHLGLSEGTPRQEYLSAKEENGAMRFRRRAS